MAEKCGHASNQLRVGDQVHGRRLPFNDTLPLCILKMIGLLAGPLHTTRRTEMEKEKKSRAIKKVATTKTQTGTTATTAPKKATKQNAKTVEMTVLPANELKNTAPQKKAEMPKVTIMKRVSHDDIAKLAHRYWIERGYQHGNPDEDWLRAERELLGKAS
jgi:hypothetical protein